MRQRYRRNGEVLREHVHLEGATVLDIGCGRGALARSMARHGAEVVIGLDANSAQLHAALAAERAGAEHYLYGVAEALPLSPASFDAAVFFNSLHHVPVPMLDAALAEATRVLRPGGTLYVCEPLAEGSCFELHQPVDDETEVRAAAYAALERCPPGELVPLVEQAYQTRLVYEHFDEFRDEVVRIDPVREAAFECEEPQLRRLFKQLGEPMLDGRAFEQPMRINVFRRT